MAAILLADATLASAARIRVAQESASGRRDFDAHILGYINPYIEREKAAADFYSYEARSQYSFNGPPRAFGTTLHIYF